MGLLLEISGNMEKKIASSHADETDIVKKLEAGDSI